MIGSQNDQSSKSCRRCDALSLRLKVLMIQTEMIYQSFNHDKFYFCASQISIHFIFKINMKSIAKEIEHMDRDLRMSNVGFKKIVDAIFLKLDIIFPKKDINEYILDSIPRRFESLNKWREVNQSMINIALIGLQSTTTCATSAKGCPTHCVHLQKSQEPKFRKFFE
jgi:hypothetical protein